MGMIYFHRKFLGIFTLPRDPSKTIRIIEQWAKSYYSANSQGPFSSDGNQKKKAGKVFNKILRCCCVGRLVHINVNIESSY